MINKTTKFFLIFFLAIIFFILALFTFNSELRRFTFFRIVAVHDFYQIKSLVKHIRVRDYSVISSKLTNYINLSK